MPSLLSLPDEVLYSIVRAALNIAQDDTAYPTRAINIRASEMVPGLLQQPHSPPIPDESTIIPLVLCCRRLSTVAIDVLLSRAAFRIRSLPALRRFTAIMSKTNMERVRNLDLTLYCDDDYRHNPSDDKANDAIIKETASLLSQFPAQLQRLRIEGPYHSWPFFVWSNETSPLLRETLMKFVDLRDFEYSDCEGLIQIDLFTNLTAPGSLYRPDLPGYQGLEELPRSRYPRLRQLRLEGCLPTDVTAPVLKLALSEEQLPSLEALALDSLLCDELCETVGYPFDPEVLKTMHPLREFEWIPYDQEAGLRRRLGEPHSALTMKHLEALQSRHGETLRILRIGFTEEDVPETNITHEFLEQFRQEMPLLHIAEFHLGEDDA